MRDSVGQDKVQEGAAYPRNPSPLQRSTGGATAWDRGGQDCGVENRDMGLATAEREYAVWA